jgi:hypothetical protein
MSFQRVFQARIIGRIHGQQTVNVLNFGSDEAAADNDALVAILVQLATQILLCVTTSLLSAVTEDWTVETVEAKQLHPALSDPVQVSAAPDTNGNLAPTNVSFAATLVNIRTGGGGRRGRGRIFLPPMGDASITNSVLSDATAGQFLTDFLECMSDKYIGPSKTENQSLGVLSRKAIATGTAFGDALRPATTLEANQTVSVMRSRKLGHGA